MRLTVYFIYLHITGHEAIPHCGHTY